MRREKSSVHLIITVWRGKKPNSAQTGKIVHINVPFLFCSLSLQKVMFICKIWHWNDKNIGSAFLCLQIWIPFPCPRTQKKSFAQGTPTTRESSLSYLQNQGSHIIMSVGIPAMVSDLRWCVLTKLHVFLRAQNSHRLCEPEAGPQTTPWDGKNKAPA